MTTPPHATGREPDANRVDLALARLTHALGGGILAVSAAGLAAHWTIDRTLTDAQNLVAAAAGCVLAWVALGAAGRERST